MFRTLIYPSSGACDYYVELPHWSYCSWFDVCWSFDVVGLEWYHSVSQDSACNTDMMDILTFETCWAQEKWNKIASDINLVFYSSTIAMMHGPINIRGFSEFVYDPTFSVRIKIPYYMLQSPVMERKVEYYFIWQISAIFPVGHAMNNLLVWREACVRDWVQPSHCLFKAKQVNT